MEQMTNSNENESWKLYFQKSVFVFFCSVLSFSLGDELKMNNLENLGEEHNTHSEQNTQIT